MKFLTSSLFLLVFSVALMAQPQTDAGYLVKENIFYRAETEMKDNYVSERCRLDLYYPAVKKGFATVVWFHGGGITGGNKYIPEKLKKQGIAIAAVNYRLSPQVQHPAYIDDAAAAVAWIFKNIQKFGGNPEKIIVSGHSAGGYLTSMVGLDKKWLAKYEVNADKIALLVPFSGHTITHMTVRHEQGIEDTQPVVDEFAPLFHVRTDAPPLLLITGDRELEMLGRYEENAYMWRMMKVAGHEETELFELDGFNHGEMVSPALEILLKKLQEFSLK